MFPWKVAVQPLLCGGKGDLEVGVQQAVGDYEMEIFREVGVEGGDRNSLEDAGPLEAERLDAEGSGGGKRTAVEPCGEFERHLGASRPAQVRQGERGLLEAKGGRCLFLVIGEPEVEAGDVHGFHRVAERCGCGRFSGRGWRGRSSVAAQRFPAPVPGAGPAVRVLPSAARETITLPPFTADVLHGWHAVPSGRRLPPSGKSAGYGHRPFR